MPRLVVFFYGALALYAVSAALALGYLRTGADRARRVGRCVAVLGFATHTVFAVWWGVGLRRLPAYTTFEALTAFLWCAVLVCFLLDLSFRTQALYGFVMPAVAVGGLAVALLADPGAEPQSSAQGWWLPVHVVTALLGAADFLVAFAVAVMYLLQRRLLKRKAVGALMEHMPSLDALDQLHYRVVALGLPVFTLALISGIVLAVPKAAAWWASWVVAASLLAWVLYAVLLHVRVGMGWRGSKAAYLTIAGFVLVLAIVCGLALVGDPLHTLRGGRAPGPRPSVVEGLPDGS